MTNKPRHKFNATRTVVDHISFASKLEANRYYQLKSLQSEGTLLFFLRQPSFDLAPKVAYRADFLCFWADGSCTIEDVKGMKTDVYNIKKKLVESIYPVEITEIK